MNCFQVEFNGNQAAPHVISPEDCPGKGADPESQDSSVGRRMAPWSVRGLWDQPRVRIPALPPPGHGTRDEPP